MTNRDNSWNQLPSNQENKAKAEEFANNHVSDVDISVDDLKALIKSV